MADKNLNLISPQELNARLTPEERSANAKKANAASHKSKRQKADLFKAMDLVMSKPVVGKPKEMLEAVGYKEEELTTGNAILVTLAEQAIKGDRKAAEILLNYQAQILENDRKNEESKARIKAMGQPTDQVQINSDDDGDGGVVIYLPKIDDDVEELTSEKKGVTPDAEDS